MRIKFYSVLFIASLTLAPSIRAQSIFGIEIGVKLNHPKCDFEFSRTGKTNTVCYASRPSSDRPLEQPESWSNYTLNFPIEDAPENSTDRTMNISIIDGKIEYIHIDLIDADKAINDLNRKFGNPTQQNSFKTTWKTKHSEIEFINTKSAYKSPLIIRSSKYLDGIRNEKIKRTPPRTRSM